MISRRSVLSRIGIGSLAGLIASGVSRAQAQSGHESHDAGMPGRRVARRRPASISRPQPATGYTAVRTLNGWTLPYNMNDGVKEFHLVAEEVEHEFAPGSVAKCWGYNGTTPGPTIEAVEGDRVRIFVTNRLKEHTTIHWHGLYAAQRYGWRRWPQSAAYPARRDVRLRVHAAAARHAHVPPACG